MFGPTLTQFVITADNSHLPSPKRTNKPLKNPPYFSSSFAHSIQKSWLLHALLIPNPNSWITSLFFSPQMDWLISLDESSLNAYKQHFNVLSLIPTSHYLLAFTVIWAAYLYNFLDIHFFRDLFSGFRGAPVSYTSHPSSPIYNHVVSKCRILHDRYTFPFFLFHREI